LNYYVYYKLPAEKIDALGAVVADILRAVEGGSGIRGRWMRRRDDPTTYMEVYEGVEDAPAFEALLEREGARLGVQRKVERFISAETRA
jgi:hypothetical protein